MPPLTGIYFIAFSQIQTLCSAEFGWDLWPIMQNTPCQGVACLIQFQTWFEQERKSLVVIDLLAKLGSSISSLNGLGSFIIYYWMLSVVRHQPFYSLLSSAKNSRQLMKILWRITASSVQFVSILMPAVLFVIK